MVECSPAILWPTQANLQDFPPGVSTEIQPIASSIKTPTIITMPGPGVLDASSKQDTVRQLRSGTRNQGNYQLRSGDGGGRVRLATTWGRTGFDL